MRGDPNGGLVGEPEWSYAWPAFPPSERPAARGGATVTLVPMGEFGPALLVLGGRQFVPPPPHVSWPAGQHLGRDDAHLLYFPGSLGWF